MLLGVGQEEVDLQKVGGEAQCFRIIYFYTKLFSKDLLE